MGFRIQCFCRQARVGFLRVLRGSMEGSQFVWRLHAVAAGDGVSDDLHFSCLMRGRGEQIVCVDLDLHDTASGKGSLRVFLQRDGYLLFFLCLIQHVLSLFSIGKKSLHRGLPLIRIHSQSGLQ